jgi:nucleoside triphosphate pyrophosphatase
MTNQIVIWSLVIAHCSFTLHLMANDKQRIILGSRSPRRLELLRLIVPAEWITVVPPASADEPDFADARDWPAIERRLADIARLKCDDVRRQVEGSGFAAMITADTVIVATDADGNPVVLGQPPESVAEAASFCTDAGSVGHVDDWHGVVAEWFEQYLLGKDHVAASAVCVEDADGRRQECVVKTRVRFDASAKRWLDWYLGSGEPRGKAGGYAIQGAGGIFVSEIEGSLSNVVGLPVKEVLEMLEEIGIVS